MYCRFHSFVVEEFSDSICSIFEEVFLSLLSAFPLLIICILLFVLLFLSFLWISAISMMVILSICARLSLSRSSFACLHFLIGLGNVLYSALYLDIAWCLFFMMLRISHVSSSVSCLVFRYVCWCRSSLRRLQSLYNQVFNIFLF